MLPPRIVPFALQLIHALSQSKVHGITALQPCTMSAPEREFSKAVALRCNLQMEAVVAEGNALVLIAVAALASCGRRTPYTTPVTSSRSHSPVMAASRDAADRAAVDAYGNEVTDAVAEYSLDPAGDLYELHSPQTELPRLASPKSLSA